MEEILFTKMHGIGNDYIYINCLTSTPPAIQQLAQEMSRPHTGVGSDGIILICPSEVADFKMRIFNADGSEARMCGNGSRCVGKYVADYGLTDSDEISLETLGGIKHITLHRDAEGRVCSATVDMGLPVNQPALVPVIAPSADPLIEFPTATLAGGMVKITAVSMGNPHGVIFVDDLNQVDVHALGRELELHPMWPDRANIEFAQIEGPQEIRMRVWERGSGETMACGTGACATAVAAMLTGRVRSDRPVTVHLLGGDLTIEMRRDGSVMMTGPAETVYEGRYYRKS